VSTEAAGQSIAAGRIRASDAEREEYARIVRESVGEGRLTLGEGDERLAAIYAATYRDDLGPSIADLPRPDTGERQGYGYRGHRGESRGEISQATTGRSGPPRLWHAVAFLRHLSFVVVVGAVLITIWALSSTHFFWPAIPLFFLVMGLMRHGMFWWVGRWRGYGRYWR
jgi:Domain of unknown function (DUF1707)